MTTAGAKSASDIAKQATGTASGVHHDVLRAYRDLSMALGTVVAGSAWG